MEHANASLRKLKGIRPFAGVMWAALVVMLLTRGFRSFSVEAAYGQVTSLQFWLIIGFVGVMLWFVMLVGRQSAAITLSPTGIEQQRGAGRVALEWKEVTEVVVASHTMTVRAEDGRSIGFSLAFVSDAAEIIQVVEGLLPDTAALRLVGRHVHDGSPR